MERSFSNYGQSVKDCCYDYSSDICPSAKYIQTRNQHSKSQKEIGVPPWPIKCCCKLHVNILYIVFHDSYEMLKINSCQKLCLLKKNSNVLELLSMPYKKTQLMLYQDLLLLNFDTFPPSNHIKTERERQDQKLLIIITKLHRVQQGIKSDSDNYRHKGQIRNMALWENHFC